MVIQTYSQISFGGTPPSFYQKIDLPSITNVEVDLNIEKLKANNLLSRQQSNNPPCIAKAISASYDMENSGTWTSLENGGEMWQLRLKAEGALAILLSYDDFYIPESSELYIYSADKTQVLGAYTSSTHPNAGAFSTEMVAGDDIILEYVSPYNHQQLFANGEFDNIPVISIDNIGYVFDNVVVKRFPSASSVNTEIGESSSCMININCTEGDNWQTEKKGVCQMTMYVSGGSSGAGWYVCSGDMINNTAQDLTPYVISAFHCYDGASTEDLAKWQFTFGYESPGCEDETPIETHTITGCYLRVASPIEGGSDGILLELTEDVPAEWDVYYNGWDRRNVITEGGGVGIHHPAGDIKKISTFETYETGTWPGESIGATDAHWNLQFVETQNGHSVTEGGSSGSSLFNSNHLIIGTLTGGNSSCTYTSGSNYYGKLWYHWDQYGSDATSQMKSWLDPLDLGVETLKGTAYNPTSPRISSENSTIELEGSETMNVAGNASKITIEGHNLDGIITATVSEPFELSADGEIWALTAQLPKEGGTLYVHFLPTTIGHQTGMIKLSNNLAPNFYITTKASSCPEFEFNLAELPVALINQSYSAVASADNATTEVVEYEITDGVLPLGVELNTTSGEIAGIPMESGNFNITLLATDENGCFSSIDYQLDVECTTISTFPFTESFEYGFPSCWTQEYVLGSMNWTNQTGGNKGNEHPEYAYDGNYNMIFRSDNYDGNTTFLVTPELDITSLVNPVLSFAHTQAAWLGDQDYMNIYYKTTADGNWNELVSYSNDIPEWKLESLSLPELSSTYYIGFKATANYAYGVVLDNVVVGDPIISSSANTLNISDFQLKNYQSFAELTISASQLVEDITVTSNAPFLVSTDNINWDTEGIINKEGGILYVSFDPSETIEGTNYINLHSTATDLTIAIQDKSTNIETQLTQNDLKVSNPFNSELNISWEGTFEEIRVIDLLGREVYTSISISDKNSLQISSSSWTPGLYFVYLKGLTNDQIIKVIKK